MGKLDELKKLSELKFDGKPPASAQDILTLKEVAAYLKIHPMTAYRLVQRNKIPHFRVGSDYRFDRHVIDKWRHDLEQRQ